MVAPRRHNHDNAEWHDSNRVPVPIPHDRKEWRGVPVIANQGCLVEFSHVPAVQCRFPYSFRNFDSVRGPLKGFQCQVTSFVNLGGQSVETALFRVTRGSGSGVGTTSHTGRNARPAGDGKISVGCACAVPRRTPLHGN